MSSEGPQASLDLTHVIYDDSSIFSLALALVTLSPILLMASYASLAVQTREFLIIVMWAGQLASEGLNWLLKQVIREDRPSDSAGTGYGFPSSHSQYMGYFSTFLICHLYFRHEFSSTGYPILDRAWRMFLYLSLVSWAGGVAYSRYHLGYHSPHQILWGVGVGAVCGFSLYLFAEVIPRRRPTSYLGQLKQFLVGNPVSTWLQLRDGWGVWADGGREEAWIAWRKEWERRRTAVGLKRTQ